MLENFIPNPTYLKLPPTNSLALQQQTQQETKTIHTPTHFFHLPLLSIVQKVSGIHRVDTPSYRTMMIRLAC
jgi:hypothetical protein